MRGIVLLLVPLASLAAVLVPASPTPSAAAATPPLAFRQYAAVLGEVGPTPAVGHRFRFTNGSDTAVTVTDLRPSCGCLEPTLEGGTETDDGRRYEPGEDGSFEVRVLTAGETPGPHAYTIDVTSRAGEETYRRQLHFTVTLPEAKVTLTPREVFFYQLSGEAGEQTVVVTDPRSDPLTVTSADSKSEWLTTEIRAEPDGHRTTVTLRVPEGLPPGLTTAWVKIRTSDPDYATLKVAVAMNGGSSDRGVTP